MAHGSGPQRPTTRITVRRCDERSQTMLLYNDTTDRFTYTRPGPKSRRQPPLFPDCFVFARGKQRQQRSGLTELRLRYKPSTDLYPLGSSLAFIVKHFATRIDQPHHPLGAFLAFIVRRHIATRTRVDQPHNPLGALLAFIVHYIAIHAIHQ